MCGENMKKSVKLVVFKLSASQDTLLKDRQINAANKEYSYWLDRN